MTRANAQPVPSPAANPVLEAECARLLRKYPVWMTASDIALEESCSVRTAQRRLDSGHYGPVDVLPDGGLRTLSKNYVEKLRGRTRIFTATA